MQTTTKPRLVQNATDQKMIGYFYWLVISISILLPSAIRGQLLIDIEGGIKIGNVTTPNPEPGTIRFKNNGFDGWNGFTWVNLGGFKIYGEVFDIDGNHYPTVKIGDQIWMAQNLRVTRYNDGTLMQIRHGQYVINFGAPGTLRYPEDKVSNAALYGGYYDFYCVETNKLCPTGWQVPNDAEWQTLIDFVGGNEVAGLSVKESGDLHWNSSNEGTNSSGFTARGAGRWHETPMETTDFRDVAYLWSRTSITYPHFMQMSSQQSSMSQVAAASKERGFSVRCLKN